MIHDRKQRLREEMRALSRVQKPQSSAAHCQAILNLPAWEKASTILLYHPILQEVSPMSLLSANDTRSFIFPRIENEALGLYLYHPGKAWTNGPFGLKEPDTETWERVSPSLIDMAIVPGLAFDKAGGRLGRGRGFYDRLLAHPGFRGIKIGLCWEWQLLPLVPCEASDARMNQVIHSGK